MTQHFYSWDEFWVAFAEVGHKMSLCSSKPDLSFPVHPSGAGQKCFSHSEMLLTLKSPQTSVPGADRITGILGRAVNLILML